MNMSQSFLNLTNSSLLPLEVIRNFDCFETFMSVDSSLYLVQPKVHSSWNLLVQVLLFLFTYYECSTWRPGPDDDRTHGGN